MLLTSFGCISAVRYDGDWQSIHSVNNVTGKEIKNELKEKKTKASRFSFIFGETSFKKVNKLLRR